MLVMLFDFWGYFRYDLPYRIFQEQIHQMLNHCVKSVRIWSYSGPYFPALGLNTERYPVSLRIQSECGENVDQNNSREWTLFTQ